MSIGAAAALVVPQIIKAVGPVGDKPRLPHVDENGIDRPGYTPITIERSLFLRSHPDEKIDISFFDHLKDVLRDNGVISQEIELLCGVGLFEKIKSLVCENTSAYYAVSRHNNFNTFVFQKNGITYTLIEGVDVHEWSMVIIHCGVDKSWKFPPSN